MPGHGLVALAWLSVRRGGVRVLSSFSFEFHFFLCWCGVEPFCSFRLDALALVVGGSAVVRVFLFRVLCESDMVLPRSTNNSMAAGFVSTACTSSSSLSSVSVAVTAGTSSSLSDQIASAVATALGNSLPAIRVAIRDNSAPVSSAPLAVTSVSSSSAMVVAGSQAAPSGTLRLPSFVSTFLLGPAISGSDSACLVDSFPSPVMSTRASGSSGGGAFVCGTFDVSGESVCCWPRTCANPGQSGLKNHQWSVCGPG